MDTRVGGQRPGILGLADVLRDHGGAVEADLIDRGFRLRWIGEEDFTIRDVLTIIENLPGESALARKLNPDSWMWSHTDHLLALVYDRLAEHNWMISRDGQRNVNRPKPLPRPGIEPDNSVRKLGGRAIPVSEMAEKVRREYLHAVPDDAPKSRSKLTDEQARAIAALLDSGRFTRQEIADSYEVSTSTISRALARLTTA